MTQLALDGARATMRKISINVLGKDADNTLFTLPLENGGAESDSNAGGRKGAH